MANEFVYISSFNGGESEGIRIFSWDSQNGALEPVGGVNEGVENPIYIDSDPQRRFLYAADMVNSCDGEKSGAVSAYAIDAKSASLKFLNSQATGGLSPCYLCAAANGKHILAANYSGGSVAVLPIQSDGRLGKRCAFQQHAGASVNTDRQTEPHPHSFLLDPANRFAFAPDLGIDKIMVYRFNADSGQLTPNEPAFVKTEAGAGPRHGRFHPNRRFGYVITELLNTIIAYSYNESNGQLVELQTVSALPDGYSDTSYCSDIHIHPSGTFLYGSNRGHDSIVVFAIDPQTGKLSFVDHTPTQGNFPRGFALDPTGRFLLAANENSGTVLTFSIDQNSGKLTPTGQVTEIPKPTCFVFAGR